MKWLKNNSLSLTLLILFLIFLIGHSVAGVRHYNNEQLSHGQPDVTYAEYVRSGDFAESVFENWESEFLQMGSYVLLTAFLFQKGSAESKKMFGNQPSDAKPRKSKSIKSPWPVQRGGMWLKLYENSLSIAFLLLFAFSFWLHAVGGSAATCEENYAHSEPSCPSVVQYMSSSKFWFESFQNWQSEYLAVFTIVVLSVYLRQRGSPESKPVNTPRAETGS